MEFNKLVRDNISEILKSKNLNPITHIATEKEFAMALNQKLYEEVNEFLENPCVEEVADIFKVSHAICLLNGIDLQTLETVRLEKTKIRGGFQQKIILEKTEKIHT